MFRRKSPSRCGPEPTQEDQAIIATGVAAGFVTTAGSVNLDYQPVSGVMWRTELRVFGSDSRVWPLRDQLKKTGGFLMSSLAITLP